MPIQLFITAGAAADCTQADERVSGNDYAFKFSDGYVSAEPSGNMDLNRKERKDWETFTLTCLETIGDTAKPFIPYGQKIIHR
jgi:hypothetical protein